MTKVGPEMIAADHDGRKGRPRDLYPWDTWFPLRRFILVRGVHYRCQPHGMYRNIVQAAQKRGLKVSIHVDGDTLNVRVVGIDNDRR